MRVAGYAERPAPQGRERSERPLQGPVRLRVPILHFFLLVSYRSDRLNTNRTDWTSLGHEYHFGYAFRQATDNTKRIPRQGHSPLRDRLALLSSHVLLRFLGNDVVIQVDTFVTDVDLGAGNDFTDLVLGLTAERTLHPTLGL